MFHDNSNHGPADSTRINIFEDYEIRYWTGQFGCTPEQLEQAVKAKGVMVAEVAAYLLRKR